MSSVTPSVTSPGEPVRVEATVRNPSAQENEFEVVLLVDELPEGEQAVRLPAGASRILRFIVVRAEPGAHVARVGHEAATFHVLSPQFAIRNLEIDPPVVAPGEPIQLRAAVENIGAAPGVFQVPLAIDGVVVDVRSTLLDVGQSATLSFETVPKAPGTYTLLVGDVPGSYTVVSPAFDLTIPSTIRISLPTTIAADKGGTRVTITSDVVSLSGVSQVAEATLPVALPAGGALAYFRDSVSGITYEDGQLTLPLRNAAYREVARLVANPNSITDDRTAVRLKLDKLRLVVPDTTLQVPSSPEGVGLISFSMEAPMAGLKLGAPVRLTPGLRPAAKDVAAMELEARKKGRTLTSVIASAAVEAPVSVSGGQESVATVTFGVPSSWLESARDGTIEISLIKENGSVELSPISETALAGAQTMVKAKVSRGLGNFALVLLSIGPPPTIEKLVFAQPVAVVGVPMEVRAQVVAGEAFPNNAVLRVNSELVAVAPVRALEGGTRAATFYLTARASGAYTVAVESKESKLEAELQDVLGHVQVSRMQVRPQEAAPGQAVELSAALSNVGPKRVVSEVFLLVNDVPVERRLLALSPGETTEASFNLTRKRNGTYRVALLNARTEFTVATAPTPASLRVEDLRVEPSTAEPGQPVAVRFAVKNTGELEGTYLAKLFVERREQDRKELMVGGLTTLPATFTFQPQGEGVFMVDVGDLRHYFVVVSPIRRSNLVLETLEIEPPTLGGGEQVVATVNIRNRATSPATGVVTMLVNGEIVAQREVTLAARGRTRETFTLSRDTPGLYEVEIRQGVTADAVSDVLKGHFLVTHRQSRASWEISRLEVLPQPAAPQEPVAVTFLLSNLGQQEGELTITVTVDGVREIEQTLLLGPQFTREVSLPVKGRPTGTYVISVNGTETRFIVTGSAGKTPEASVTPETAAVEPGAGPWAILLGAGVLAVVLGAAYWLFRRRRAGGTPA